MSGAPADVGFYKGVIYKTNEKSKQFVDIRGVFYEAWCGKKEKQERPHFLNWNYCFIKAEGLALATIEQTHWKVSRGYQQHSVWAFRMMHKRLQHTGAHVWQHLAGSDGSASDMIIQFKHSLERVTSDANSPKLGALCFAVIRTSGRISVGRRGDMHTMLITFECRVRCFSGLIQFR